MKDTNVEEPQSKGAGMTLFWVVVIVVVLGVAAFYFLQGTKKPADKPVLTPVKNEVQVSPQPTLTPKPPEVPTPTPAPQEQGTETAVQPAQQGNVCKKELTAGQTLITNDLFEKEIKAYTGDHGNEAEYVEFGGGDRLIVKFEDGYTEAITCEAFSFATK